MRDRWDRPARGTVSMGVPPPATSTATGAPVDFEHDMRGLVKRLQAMIEETRRSPERFRDELGQAIDALRAEIPIPDGPRHYVTVTPRAADAETPRSEPWPPEGTVAVQTYVGNPPRPIGDGR